MTIPEQGTPTTLRFAEVDLADASYVRVTARLNANGFDVRAKLWVPDDSSTGRQRFARGEHHKPGVKLTDMIQHFPGLEPLVRVRLAGPDGAPRNAASNAVFFYRGGGIQDSSPAELCANWLRVSVDELPVDADDDTLRAFVASLRERWAAEAAAAMEVLLSLDEVDRPDQG